MVPVLSKLLGGVPVAFAEDCVGPVATTARGGSRWPGGRLVASEPLDDDGAWLPVAEDHVVRMTTDGLTIEAVSW